MALNSLGLGILLQAKDEFSSVMVRAQAEFGRTEHASDRMVAGIKQNMKTFAAGTAIAAAGAATLYTAFNLAGTAARGQLLIAQAARGSVEQMEALDKAAENEALKGMGDSADEAANQLRVLSVQANLGAEAAAKVLSPSLLLAKASFGELSREAAALGLGQILREFNVQASQSNVVVDKMATVSQAVGTNLKDLQSMMIGAATGANLAGASLEDVAIAAALINKAIPDTGRATMALNQAFLQLSGGQAAKKIKSMFGVDVIDAATGKMRPLIEILGALNEKMARLGEGKRSAALGQIFGMRAAGGVDTLLDQLQKGLKGANGEMVTGAALAADLQARLQGSSGAAQKMASSMSGIYAKEMEKLKASKDTLKDLLGGPFIAILTPLLTLVNRIVTGINQAIASIPGPVKETMAKVFVAVGGIMTALGGFIALKAAMALLPALFGYLGISLGGILATLWPVLLAFGAGALIIAAFAANAKQAGGEGAWGGLLQSFSRLKLTFTALMELFAQGGFSRATYNEMQKAENQGVMRFAVRIWYWVGRIETFLDKLVTGFETMVEKLTPSFEAFTGCLDLLAEAFGITDMSARESVDGWEATGREGKTTGAILAEVAGVLINTVSMAMLAVATTVGVAREAWQILGPVVTPVVRALISAVELIAGLFTGDWSAVWKGFSGIVIDAVDLSVGIVGAFARVLAWTIDLLGKMVGKDLGFGPMIRSELNDVHAEIAAFRDKVTGPEIQISGPAAAETSEIGGISMASGSSEMSPAVAMASRFAPVPSGPMSTTAAAEAAALTSHASSETLTVNLVLDGEKIAQSQARRNASLVARSMGTARDPWTMENVLKGAL